MGTVQSGNQIKFAKKSTFHFLCLKVSMVALSLPEGEVLESEYTEVSLER